MTKILNCIEVSKPLEPYNKRALLKALLKNAYTIGVPYARMSNAYTNREYIYGNGKVHSKPYKNA